MHEWWVSLLEPDGLLLRDRVLTAVDPDDLLTALRSGRLRRIQRGIYLPRRVEATPTVFARAALLSCVDGFAPRRTLSPSSSGGAVVPAA